MGAQIIHNVANVTMVKLMEGGHKSTTLLAYHSCCVSKFYSFLIFSPRVHVNSREILEK